MASVDLAYPANRRTFGPWVMDFPTLLIRDATKKNGFYKRVFEHGHFNLKDVHEWGYIITSEDIGKLFGREPNTCNFWTKIMQFSMETILELIFRK